MEKESMIFQKAERSYYSTPNGWRLATFEEAKKGLENIKKEGFLNKWDRARLLDGWISGPGYDFEMGDDFRGCLGYMLLIQTQAAENLTSGSAYEHVNLSDFGKEVALFLCVDDWNYEVVYWLLNSWSKSDKTMDLADVREGSIQFSDVATFTEMNRMMGYVARRLGDEGGAASERAGKMKYSGLDSVKEMLSGMIKIVTEEENIKRLVSGFLEEFRSVVPQQYSLPNSVETGDVDAAFWIFVCDSFAGCFVEVSAYKSLKFLRRMTTKTKDQKNFNIATSILLYLSAYRSDIIHEPLAHKCRGSCAEKILCYAADKAAGDTERFNGILKKNAMWSCYDNRKYHLLDKLLIILAKGEFIHIQPVEEITDVLVVNRLLECGAQPGPAYAIVKRKHETALHHAATSYSEEYGMQVAESLLGKCDANQREVLANTPDEKGRTALHRASAEGKAPMCQLLLRYGARLDAQDKNGRTPLHYAVEEDDEEVINVFMENPRIMSELADFKDKSGDSPCDIAVATCDIGLATKLLSKSKQPEAYFDRVDKGQLLRHSLLYGYANIVKMLFDERTMLPDDEEGKTALHLAVMCDDEDRARDMVRIVLEAETQEKKEKLLAKGDKKGRTVLQDAALKGYMYISERFLRINPDIIYSKSRDGRNALYDSVNGKYKGTDLLHKLLDEYLKKNKHVDDLIDRRGLTPLHVAASEGKTELVTELLSKQKFKENYLSRGDLLGQTALHKAAKNGDSRTVEILLTHGAHPLKERDCDGRTALHYAVQANTDDDKTILAGKLLERCKSNEEKILFLWASAAGLGTAEENLRNGDALQTFLAKQKAKIGAHLKTENLLKTAACLGDREMTKELITRGYQIEDIHDPEWKRELAPDLKQNVERVSSRIGKIAEQGNDRPTLSDNLGRLVYAQGLAALFLNPYLTTSIAVGISGSWGMGKSSLMVQTESILLTTAAQLALFPSSKLSSSALEMPDLKPFELSKKGKRKYEEIQTQINYFYKLKVNRNIFVILMDKIKSWVKQTDEREQNGYNQKQRLEDFLNNYDPKYRKVFKSLAAMDSSDMFKTNSRQLGENSSDERNVPAVLTVLYNAWKYRNATEALAGMAVEITKELEGIMTQAQWLSTCWRNTWKKKKYTIWIECFFPCLLALVLACSFTWIAWVVFDSDKFKEWAKAKYAWPPAAIVIIVWIVTKSVMGILKPVSTQLMHYISFPDHSDKLGYQERVISDISFLQKEIGKKPYWVFIVLAWVFTALAVLWRLVAEVWVTSLLFRHARLGNVMELPKLAPASGTNLRIIVFVDDLDRCEDSVILQVLSAINLVLAQCQISVVLGMDRELIERAITKKHGDVKAKKSLKSSAELAQKYLQKIIQLPLDLPEPSEEQSREFLKEQLGVFEKELDLPDRREEQSRRSLEVQLGRFEEASKDCGSDTTIMPDDGERDTPPQAVGEIAINLQASSEIAEMDTTWTLPVPTGKEAPSQTDLDDINTGKNKSWNSRILMREVVLVRYGQPEEDAFFYFHKLTIGCRQFLPREWKVLLSYHRLVRNILCISNGAKHVIGWKVQLISWIFICWQWEENMNLLIENWNKVAVLRASGYHAPSLLNIVEHFIEEEDRHKNMKMKVISHEDALKITEHPKKNKKTSVKSGGVETSVTEVERSADKTRNIEKLESSSREADILPKAGEDNMQIITNSGGETSLNKKLDKLERTVSELKKEIIELRKLNELKDQVSVKLKKDINEINELQEQSKMKSGKINQKNAEEHKIKLQNLSHWFKIKSALEMYDVTMEGIQAFQRFRFYCIAAHLPG